MSTSLLLIGAIAMFLAVFAIAYSLQTIVAERRQAYRTLQAIRAVEVRPSDLRNRELARPARERVLGFLAFGLLGYLLPNIVLTNAVQRRQNEIRSTLADSIDLLTICVEAGLGFDAALAHVSRNTDGPLADEFYRTLQEVQLGRSRNEAMRNLADRSNIPELRAFVLAMVQADIFGVSVANVLRIQAKDMRVKRRQMAEERAMKVPIKVLFPVLFCIFPALFVVILGPAIMRIADVFATR